MMLVGESTLENVRTYFPDILYKFRDWRNIRHKEIFSKQEVFFAPPGSFDDKSDCRFPIEWDFSYETWRPSLDKLFKGDKSIMLQKDYEFALKEQHRINVGTEYAQRNFIEHYYTLNNHHLGVLSLTARNENLKIWQSAYAVDFEGFGVGIGFKDCLEELAENGIGGGMVSYVPHNHPKFNYVAPSTHSSDEVMALHIELIHTKYVDYDFEEEYRLTKRIYKKPFLGKITLQDRLFQVPKRCFREVIFGYKMPDSMRKEIIQVCQSQELPVSYFQASITDSGDVSVTAYT